jgi:hypothetical protein
VIVFSILHNAYDLKASSIRPFEVSADGVCWRAKNLASEKFIDFYYKGCVFVIMARQCSSGQQSGARSSGTFQIPISNPSTTGSATSRIRLDANAIIDG